MHLLGLCANYQFFMCSPFMCFANPHSCFNTSVKLWAEKKSMVLHTRANAEGKCNPRVSKYMTYSPHSPQRSLILKKIPETTVLKKKKENRAKVCWCVKTDKVKSKPLELSLIWSWTFLNVSGASSAQWPPGLRETAQRFSRRYGQSSFD